MKSALTRAGLLALTAATLGVMGCAPAKTPEAQVRVRAIVGPDGTQMLHISCGEDEGLCYQAAGERCPAGYDVGKTHSMLVGNFFVRCRPPSYSDAWSVRGGASPSTPLPAPPPTQSTAVPSASAPAYYPRPGEFDVGY